MIDATAYAKINLYLKVLGKRADGYHELETVFCEISLADQLRYQPASTPLRLTISGADLSAGEDNLIIRAARVFARRYGHSVGGEVFLDKHIPMGGGLGGGSSDAAAMLRMLARLHGTEKDVDALLTMAAELGSDVPFFILGGCQLGQGRGERLTPFELPGEIRGGFLAHLPIHMPTAEVFRTYAAIQSGPRTASAQPAVIGDNDLWAAACAVSPKFEQSWFSLKHHLTDEVFFMTGSGSTLVWLTKTQTVPQTLRKRMVEWGGEWLPFTVLPRRSPV